MCCIDHKMQHPLYNNTYSCIIIPVCIISGLVSSHVTYLQSKSLRRQILPLAQVDERKS